MVVYLDLCCLKRPFDDRSLPLVRLEVEAVLEALSIRVCDPLTLARKVVS